ncbi:MAG: stage V sporulation protein AD [Bacilli bacterium]|jgi:stage V sporulation protein AD
MRLGKQSIAFDNVYVGEAAVAAGPKEKLGPLGAYFDRGYDDLYCGMKTWEKAEMRLLRDAVEQCLVKNNIGSGEVDCFIGGDLNNQIVIQSYVMREYDIPYLGVFGACSTSVEGIIIGAGMIAGGAFNRVLAGTSSHNATSERQFRYPTEYGGQKPDTLTFTATAAGVVLLKNSPTDIKLTGVTIGKVIDAKLKDPLDLGRAMAPAAFDTIDAHFKDFNTKPEDYDLIVTGDLSYYGKDMLVRMFGEVGIDISERYNDCGLMLYDREKQQVFAGGSGCGCCAAVTYGYLLAKLRDKTYKRILVVATGALLNPIIVAQKETIPGVAHAAVIERSGI